MAVIVNLRPLRKFTKEIDDALQGRSRGPVYKAIIAWGAIYRAWAQSRFDQYSRGGGEWPPLSQRTLARKKRLHIPALILVETGTLRAALRPEVNREKGAVQMWVAGKGIRLGYGGSALHPGPLDAPMDTTRRTRITKTRLRGPGRMTSIRPSRSQRRATVRRRTAGRRRQPAAQRVGNRKQMTVAEIAEIHQFGLGVVPARPIIVLPPDSVVDQMADLMRNALRAIAPKK